MSWNKVPIAVIPLLILFPALNLVGWFTGSVFLVQFRPEYSPLVPNASLLFILAGFSLLCHFLGRWRTGAICAILILLVATLSGLEYLLDLNLGIDTLFVRVSQPFLSGVPGRFSPNAAICFLLSALSLLIVNQPSWFRRAYYPVGLLGSTVSALGGMALLGYVFDVEAAFSWGRLAKMSLFASIAFWLLGLAIMIIAWRREEEGAREPSARFIAICLALGTAAASLVFWKALVIQEQKQAQRTVASEMQILESELRGEMRLRIQAMEKLGQRWDVMGRPDKTQWQYEAVLTLRNLRGYQALEWADTSLRVVWAAPASGNEEVLGKSPVGDSVAEMAMEAARRMGNMQVSHASDLPQGGRGFLVFEPVMADGVFAGVLVGAFRFEDLFREIVPPSTLDEYAVAIFDGKERVYPAKDPFEAARRQWIQSGVVDFRGTSWTLEIQPRHAFLQQELSNLPHMVLAGGLLIALLMAAALHYGQRSFHHAQSLRRTNSELQRSRENFANIVDKNADGIVVADAGGVVRFANPMAADLLGLPAGGLIGMACPFPMELGPNRDLAWQRPASRERMILAISITATDWEGKPAVIANLRDISERVRTREALRLSESKLRRLVDSNIAGIFFADGQGLVREANEAFLRLVGYAPEDLARGGVRWAELMSSEFQAVHEQVMGEIRDSGISAPRENIYLRKDGGTVWVMVAAAALGEGQGTVAFVVDIQDRKSAEEALRKNEEQLRQAQKMDAVGRLAGGVAHDFNNLLTAINGYSEILLGVLEPESPHRSAIDEIRKAGEKAAGLTRQLLSFSRKQVVIPKILDANAVVSDMVSLISRLIGEDIALDVVLDPDAGHVKADAGLVQQVILNLAINSRDAMSGGGSLHIETASAELGEEVPGFHLKAPPGRYLAVTVRDTGCGMDDSVRSHLFEPFFSTKEKGRGTGLGLSTVYGIVKQFNGAIKVESRLGAGTAFTIYLPRADGKVKPVTPRVQRQQPGWGRGRETILLVEDEEAVRKMARRILEEKGYRVAAAADAGEAIAYMDRDGGAVGLVLTDVIMPGMSGRELADRIRETHPGLPIVFMSGYTEDGAIEKGAQSPGTAFLAKPFSPEALVQSVRETLDAA